MTASGKYLVIEANTLEVCKHQRIFIEDALKKGGLLPARRVELEGALQLALMKENAARQAADEEDAENKKKGDGGDSGDGDGQQGSSSGSGGGSGAGGGNIGDEGGDEYDETELELFELFLLLMDSDARRHEKSLANDRSILEPLAAATLLFNRHDKVAQIDESYTLERANSPHSPSAFLPSLERHAVGLGARAMQLKVHPDAVDFFQKKCGYKPHGVVITRKGRPIQRMRKTLIPTQPPQD